MGGGLEPTTQAGVFGGSALATIFERATVHWTFDVVNQVEETTEVTCGEVVSDALENVEDLVVRYPAVVVLIGLFVECSEDLVNGHHFLILTARWFMLLRFLLQESGEKHASLDSLGALLVPTVLLFTTVLLVPTMPAAILAEVCVATSTAIKWTMVLLVAAILIFRMVPAAQRWRFGGAVHLVDSLLGQHGGDLIPL